MKRIRIATLITTLSLTTVLAAQEQQLGQSSQAVRHGVATVQEMNTDEMHGASAFSLVPHLTAESWTLEVSGPSGYFSAQFEGHDTPSMSLVRGDASFDDGTYKYVLSGTTRSGEQLRASGEFEVRGGVSSAIVPTPDELWLRDGPETTAINSSSTHSGGGKADGLHTKVASDQVVSDDLIVTGGVCAGGHCVNGESFGFNELLIDDSGGFAAIELRPSGSTSLDWRIQGETTPNEFHIIGQNEVFTLSHSAPAASITVDASGRVGLGTITPAQKLDVRGLLRVGTNPTDYAELWVGNVGNWIRDNDGDNVVKINHNSGDNSLVVDSSRVGVGTSAPAVPLHVRQTDARLRVESFGGGFKTLLDLQHAGTPGFRFQDTTGGFDGIWQFRMGSAGSGYPFVISNQGSAGNQMQLNANGNMTILGTLTQGSSRTRKENFTAVDRRDILSRVASLPMSTWSYKGDAGVRHLGPIAEDFYEIFEVGSTPQGISSIDSSGVALAAIQGLNELFEETVDQKEAEIAALEERLARLEQMVLAQGQQQ